MDPQKAISNGGQCVSPKIQDRCWSQITIPVEQILRILRVGLSEEHRWTPSMCNSPNEYNRNLPEWRHQICTWIVEVSLTLAPLHLEYMPHSGMVHQDRIVLSIHRAGYYSLLNSILTNIIYLSFPKLLFLQVAQEFRFSIETVAVSVNYFDRLVSAHVIAHTQLQTHALACIYIASKQVSFLSRIFSCAAIWGTTPYILNTSLFYSNLIK